VRLTRLNPRWTSSLCLGVIAAGVGESRKKTHKIFFYLARKSVSVTFSECRLFSVILVVLWLEYGSGSISLVQCGSGSSPGSGARVLVTEYFKILHPEIMKFFSSKI
jgi:hypothetical protein